MDNVELIVELETLKQKLAHYETVVQPLADRELQRLREQAVKEYQLNEEEAKIMAERLAEVSTEDGIKATAVQLAGDFRATNTPKYLDPRGMGNGARQGYKQTTPQEHGKRMYQRLANNGMVKGVNGRDYGNGSNRTSVTLPKTPAPTPTPKPSEKEKQRNIIARVFGRK
ncbi:hypothetical protein ACQCVB_17740 [Fictibacillus phosphorivorans]|uniref:hypothetical protein n=1 Tax=Fictibacillus phosphorivorans TaxID=1221500 RepID=UPI003CEEF748